MSSSRKPGLERIMSGMPHYQTFPTNPPAGRGKPPAQPTRQGDDLSPTELHTGSSEPHQESPLPTRQLFVLAVIALAEQTALNSISPYLPDMASTFPEVKQDEVGVYVGLIASSFAMAQFATNYFWGWLSDRIGRKPVILTGTILTAACFVAFGFCKTLWQAILVQALMGFVNGNQGVVSTCLGEITDRSNQSKAFIYLPVVYGLGGITGPIVGGLLVRGQSGAKYPYLLPNLVSAVVLTLDFIITLFYLEESMEEARELPPLRKRMSNLFAWLWQFTGSSQRPTYTRPTSSGHVGSSGPGEDEAYVSDDDSNDSEAELITSSGNGGLRARDVLNRDVILILVTYFIFQLSNIAYNSLYPIFAQAPPPTGRSLSPKEIGVSLAFAGGITIAFQIGIFGRLRGSIGNRTTYRAGLAGFVIAFVLMPWVGYSDTNDKAVTAGKVWLWIELGAVLIIKTVAAVGGLTSALLLITNSARDHTVLGALNGLAQTLSAAGRAVGPFISGGLFSLATRVHPKGEALAFGVFGGISLIGFLISFGIRGAGLEDSEWDEEYRDDDDANEGAEAEETRATDGAADEHSRLLNGHHK
ncbi:hypothetical protein FH972_021476 [Carpinus fangiana]|uniref:Major facilitator superfamily (MFS) profile domain-containing protein n=1 Tax=Carpinus fangiana TaxID=176857 RepID=A0A5N6KPF1_9ROSI|nr:hypothetical protein FH972_021476 [Carpinus fangiana]